MKQLKKLIMLSIAATLLVSVPAGAASDVVTLKVSHFLPTSSNFHQKILLPWCEKISKESGGKLKCQIYPSMQLGGTPAQLLDQVRDGVADIVWTLPTYQAGRFTKAEVFELPFMAKSSEGGSQALWEYVQKNAQDEFKGTKLLFTHLHDGNQMHFGKKSVKTLEDLKGLKLRAPSRIGSKTLTALGAVPVQMPAPAVPESISKSVVDGASIPWEVTTAFKLQEICKTHTETAPGQAKHAYSIFTFAMNPAKYNRLSPELKKVIDNNSGLAASKWAGKTFDSFTVAARKIAVERRNTFNVLTDAEYKRWVKACENVDNDWIKEVNAKGGNGVALLKDARALLKKYHD
ncbi:TRAP proton/solute symporter, periplasmic substrate-binding protein [Geotalea daltonii FRC-32]|uniref:TRAP proton/solute symporter, periplasmic substrate-binding protein n=1 Tax=Geotalea daltonii (strain DSM 22248 / JCM 15807 / FRC-32) TaxID=316067 RepID=B9M8N3_GEODF|nr:TRAP transporter substrate-binding protein [Geotalea daltonii]ACM18568.1 TRAP proton/solute symporter, periplasmic substrate-binding protein [Geotalea daltonii FRC-32]